jgi:hypothetical protein
VHAADLLVFQIIDKTIRNSKFCCLFEAIPYYHNAFTFTLFLPEGRVGVAWEPSNKMMLFLPSRKIKCLSLHPLISSLNLLFGFVGLIKIWTVSSHLCQGLPSPTKISTHFSSLICELRLYPTASFSILSLKVSGEENAVVWRLTTGILATSVGSPAPCWGSGNEFQSSRWMMTSRGCFMVTSTLFI